MTPDNTIQASKPRAWLTLDEYCRHIDRTERTVRRWLAKGQLPDAILLDGQWTIPADAVPGEPQPITDLSVMTPDTTPDRTRGPSLTELVNELPGFVPLDLAAEALGIPETVIRRNRDHFYLLPFGAHGALVMPRHRIKEILG